MKGLVFEVFICALWVPGIWFIRHLVRIYGSVDNSPFVAILIAFGLMGAPIVLLIVYSDEITKNY